MVWRVRTVSPVDASRTRTPARVPAIVEDSFELSWREMYRPSGLTTTGPGEPTVSDADADLCWGADSLEVVHSRDSIVGETVSDQRSEPSCGSSAARMVSSTILELSAALMHRTMTGPDAVARLFP